MPTTITPTVEFPMVCARCSHKQGMPFMAGTVVNAQVIAVGMRCQRCGHEWKIEVPTVARPNPPSTKTA